MSTNKVKNVFRRIQKQAMQFRIDHPHLNLTGVEPKTNERMLKKQNVTDSSL